MATIGEKEVLSFYGLKSPPYSAKKLSTATSKKKHTENSQYDESEWVIYKDGKEVKPSQFQSNNKAYNKCSITGEKGIIITNQKVFIENKDKASMGADSYSTTDLYDSSGSSYSMGMGADAGASFGWIEAVDYGPKGHDENIIKRVQFAKVCLLKECYEWTGILLSNEPKELTNSKIDYWE